VVGVGISALVGGDVAVPRTAFSAGFLVSTLVASLLLGPLGEEGGWRGFALPRLQRRFGALSGTVILGLSWIVWHLPVWLLPGTPMAEDPFLPWALYCLALTIVITVAYNLGSGSILVAMVAHFAANFASSFVMGLGLLSVARFFAVVPLLLFLLAAILIVVFGPSRLGSPVNEGVGLEREGHRAIGAIPG
jgi:membrane protease YdiL (CAAX protease family)